MDAFKVRLTDTHQNSINLSKRRNNQSASINQETERDI